MNEGPTGMVDGRRQMHPFLVSARMPPTERNELGDTVVFISCFATETEALERVAVELNPGWHVEKVLGELFPVESEALRIGPAEIRQLSFTLPEAEHGQNPDHPQRAV